MEAAALAERDEPVDDGRELLRLLHRRDDLLMANERGREIGEHRGAVAGSPAELSARIAVTHGFFLLCLILRRLRSSRLEG